MTKEQIERKVNEFLNGIQIEQESPVREAANEIQSLMDSLHQQIIEAEQHGDSSGAKDLLSWKIEAAKMKRALCENPVAIIASGIQ